MTARDEGPDRLCLGDRVMHMDREWTVMRVSAVAPRVLCKEGHPPKWGGETKWLYNDEVVKP